MSELKPCPFCGSTNLYIDGYEHAAGKRWRVVCLDCMATVDPGTIQQKYRAIEAWNRRAQPANEPLSIAQLKQMDGEPVWVVSDRVNGHRAEWKIVVHCGPNCTEWIGTESAWSNADYGKTWLAYDHKPGGNTEK